MKENRVCNSCLDSCENAFYLVKLSNAEDSGPMVVCASCNQAFKQSIKKSNVFIRVREILQGFLHKTVK